jgi:hypothetical protein
MQQQEEETEEKPTQDKKSDEWVRRHLTHREEKESLHSSLTAMHSLPYLIPGLECE